MDSDIERKKLAYIAELEERTVDDVLQDLKQQEEIDKDKTIDIDPPSPDKTNDIEQYPNFGLS